MLKKVALFSELLFGIKGIGPTDEFWYLYDLFMGVLARNILKLKKIFPERFYPGYFIRRDIIARSRNRENCLFYCPARTNLIFYAMPQQDSGIWAFMGTLVDRGDVCVDVGSASGGYTIPLAKIVGKKGLIFSIEPSPTYKIIEKNVKLNGFRNVKIINKAAFNKKAKLDFYFDDKITGWSSVYKRWVEKYTKNLMKLEVDAEPLDAIVSPVKRIKLLKIDVEGAELDVFRGAKNTLKKTELIIYEASKKPNIQISRMLNDLGFTVKLLSGDEDFGNFLAYKV